MKQAKEGNCFLLDLEEDKVDIYSEMFSNDISGEIKQLVKKVLSSFFLDKSWFEGGKIPNQILHSEENIDLVVSTTMVDAVLAANDMMGESEEFMSEDEEDDDLPLPKDTLLILKIIDDCKEKGIPKPFIPGIILIYLEQCEGLEI